MGEIQKYIFFTPYRQVETEVGQRKVCVEKAKTN